MVTIKSIHIKNFRSIVDETIEFTDFNCFVGKNDSGKSNVLKALNLFFNGKTDFNTDFDFQNDYSKFAHRSPKQAKEIVITLEVLIPDTFKEKGIKKWTKIWRTTGLHADNLSSLFNPGSKGFTLLDRVQYLYIPAVKSNEYFKDLLSDVYLSMTKAANSALKELNEAYSEQLRSLTWGLSRQIKSVLGLDSSVQMPENLNTLFRDLSFSTSDKYVKGIDLNHRGDGIKARHIPSILQYMQKNTEQGRPKKSVGGSYVWGFEEPENGVEFLSCFEMADELYGYRTNTQILVTTHSPAFYMKHDCLDVVCYHVHKNQAGISEYTPGVNIESLNEELGFLPIVAPYIKKARDQYLQESASIAEELRRVKAELQKISDKIIIITEGKTDIKHIQTAFSQLGLDQTMLARIEYYDFGEKKTLGDELRKLLSNLSSIPNTNIIIAILDRDKTIIPCQNGMSYAELPNNVFKFNIPGLETDERSLESKICIEHYYTNAEIQRETGHGHLYMGKDFSKFGVSSDGKWIFQKFQQNNSITEISIVDGTNTHLQRIADDAKIATKDQFAEYVSSHPEEFDFRNFQKIYDVICEIYTHVKGSGTTEEVQLPLALASTG